MRKTTHTLALLFAGFSAAYAQNVGIGTNAPNASAKLDITSTNSGVLIPRVALTSTTVAGPVATPATSLLVYNTAAIADVTPGFYYWNGTRWVRLSDSNDWIVGTTAAGTNSIGAAGTIGFLGTSTNSHIDLVTNGVVRGRLSNLGEFFIGTTNTTLPGDLMNGVGNATFPWAVNGYTSFNGGGVYGAVQAGTTNFGAVQGEYSGTGATGTGVRGTYMTGTAGTGFNACATGVVGTATTAGTYKFGVYGSGGNTTRSGGVIGYDYGIAMGALGYYAFSGVDYAVYGFSQAHTNGVATGKPVGGDGDVAFDPQGDSYKSAQELGPNNSIGLGIYGGVMGGWVRGLKYGFNVKGETYSMYVDGKGYTNQPLAYLMPTATQERVPGFMTTSMAPEVSSKGKIALQAGKVFVTFDDQFKKVMSGNLDDLIITATPQGSSQGIYIQKITPEGFWIYENNNGQSNVQVAWMATSPVKGADVSVAAELLNQEFDVNMNGLMFNDIDEQNTPKSLWWDGQQMRWDFPNPALFKKTAMLPPANTRQQ